MAGRMKPAMLETHVRRLLRASRVDPHFMIRREIFPKASNVRRNAARRLLGLNFLGLPYRHLRRPELRRHAVRRGYLTAYMRMWRKKKPPE